MHGILGAISHLSARDSAIADTLESATTPAELDAAKAALHAVVDEDLDPRTAQANRTFWAAYHAAKKDV